LGSAIIDELNSYTEVSQSGKGWHVIVKGNLPAGRNRAGRVEMYDTGRFFVMTGKTATGIGSDAIVPGDIATLQKKMAEGALEPKAFAQAIGGVDDSAEDFRLIAEVQKQINATNADKLEEAFHQRHPERYSARNREKGNRAGKSYFRYTIDNFIARNPTPKLPIVDESEIDTTEEPLPEFPRLVGPLHDIAEAITHDLAYPHKALGLLTYVGVALSGRVKLAGEPWLQPRLYGCTVGPAGFGKTAVDKEIQAALDGLFNLHVIDSVESGQALVETLSKNPRLMLAPDEISDLFIKGKQTANSNSSLLTELLKLYEKNKTSRRVITRRKRKDDDDPSIDETIIRDAHLAVFGGATTQNFEQIWQATGGGRTGLQSRFTLSYSEQLMPRLKTATDEEALGIAVSSLERIFDRYLASDEKESPAMAYFHLTQDAQDEITGWHIFDDELLARHPRILDMAKRHALILAATTGLTDIDGATMQQGLAFADYQIAVKDRLMPPDSSNNVEAFEKRILNFYRKREKPCSKEVCINKIRPEDSPGAFTAFNAAWRALETAEKIVVAAKTRKGRAAYVVA
jgi:hypothetical protein